MLEARLAMSMREGRSVEQTELAKLVGVTPQSWSNWEMGGEPNYDKLPLIARTLGTTVGWLVAGEGEPPGTSRLSKPHRFPVEQDEPPAKPALRKRR